MTIKDIVKGRYGAFWLVGHFMKMLFLPLSRDQAESIAKLGFILVILCLTNITLSVWNMIVIGLLLCSVTVNSRAGQRMN